jgi:hypothetical protein
MTMKKRSKEPMKKQVMAKSSSGMSYPPSPAPKRVRHVVAVDEARERVDEDQLLSIETPDGVDELGEELGETYVEDVTGADDAATEHRAVDTLEDEGGPFVVTTAAREFALGTDASNPADAEREALPMVSAHQPR